MPRMDSSRAIARPQKRWPIALALAAAVGLVIGALGGRWFAGPDFGDDFGVGLLAVERCESRCVSMSNSDAIDKLENDIAEIKAANLKLPMNQQIPVPLPPWHGFPVVGIIALVTALVAAAALALGAFLALARKRVALPVMPTTIAVLALAVSIITGCIFLATKPALMDLMTLGWTFVVFGASAVFGLAAVFPLNRLIRPIDVDLGAAAATMSWGGSRDELV